VKIMVAMSGGVDSSVTAALLKKEGHDVVGATLRLFPPAAGQPDTAEDAKKVAQFLGIPHYIIDLQDTFARTIIADFCRDYRAGRTPNPCINCNRIIKFGILADAARETAADYLATGHYARIEKATDGSNVLKKGLDPAKDQSYFLCRLTQPQLDYTLFPLGGMTKKEVKQIALEMGLPTASRPESQEICFVTGGDYATFLDSYDSTPSPPGPIMDTKGKVLGQHRGIRYFTIGQRKGLGISSPNPLYVTAILPEKNAVIVGAKEETYADELVANNLNWINGPPSFPPNVKARIRYRHPEASATVTPLENNVVYVKFAAPQMAVTPGQAVVFYDSDTLLGGGTIVRQGR
jgi:tRNA-specific 2-thiouridylase